jgi:hypothetical protein
MDRLQTCLFSCRREIVANPETGKFRLKSWQYIVRIEEIYGIGVSDKH